MSLSKNQFKLITSLQQKKQRVKHNMFVAEGVKVVKELLASSYKVVNLFVIDGYDGDFGVDNVNSISEADLKRISCLKSPNKVLGVFEIPEKTALISKGLIVALDDINDPGNLGTIIRLCDWFGVQQIMCSENTVDCYNQKVVQATMGSMARVRLRYTNLEMYLQNVNTPIFAADMNGDNVYKTRLPKEGVLVMGNEANGLSEGIRGIVQHKISIPRFGNLQQTESLNVATATAILLSEFKRF